MRPIFVGIAASLIVFSGFAPIIPGRYVPGASQDRTFSMTDAFLRSGAPGQIGAKLFNTAAHAAETAGDAIDFSKLVKIGAETFSINVDPSVSMKTISSNSVRKIGYGHETRVSIVTTATGVYSTDGLASHHVLYPGIEVKAVDAEENGATRIFVLGGNGAWIATNISQQNSFVTFGEMPGGGRYVTGKSGSCIVGKQFAGCS